MILEILKLNEVAMITAMEICKVLKDNGYQSYLVGGFVRDLILGKSSSDIDIATDAPPNVLCDIFDREYFRVIPTGISHGTVTVIHEHLNPNKGYEVTVFRKDVSCDGRYAKVEFINDLIEDLARRDFTMNAIAYDPFGNKFIDPHNGIADIHNKIIRCVGDPNERFKEDYLRMLRACRFVSTLGFHLEDSTKEAMYLLGGNIKGISVERIKSEIDKCFNKSNEPSVMFTILHKSAMLHHILSELKACYGFMQNKYHTHDVFTHSMKTVDAVPKEYPLIRWAALFHDLGKPETCQNYGTPEASFYNHEVASERIARDIMKRLKFSNDDTDYIANLVKHHMFKCSMEMKDSAIRRFVNKLGEQYVDDICILKYADRVGNGIREARGKGLDIEGTLLKRRYLETKAKSNVFGIKDLAINGNDILNEFNLKPGPSIGKLLNHCLDMVMDNPMLNNKNILLQQCNYLIYKDMF